MTVKKLVMAVDCGIAINPSPPPGRSKAAWSQALGYALCEEMVYDEQGVCWQRALATTASTRRDEMPELRVILVQTYEPSGPYGAKAVAEIPMDGVAPAMANAIYDATGVRLRRSPSRQSGSGGRCRGKG